MPFPPRRATMRPRSRDAQSGFTLLELLVVIVILGLLVTFVAPAVFKQLGNARTSVAKQSIERIAGTLDLYKLDVGRYPNSDEGLQALVTQPTGVSSWNGPYVQGGKPPLDPWNNPYVYTNPSSRSGHDFDLCSNGPGGATGQQGEKICNP